MACQVYVRTLFFCIHFKDPNEIPAHLRSPNCRLYHCHFEIGLCSAKEGYTPVSAVLRMGYLLAHPPHRNKGAHQRTQAARTVPLS